MEFIMSAVVVVLFFGVMFADGVSGKTCLGVSGGGIRSFLDGLVFFEKYKESSNTVKFDEFYGVSGGGWSVQAMTTGGSIIREYTDLGEKVAMHHITSSALFYLEWIKYQKKVIEEQASGKIRNEKNVHILFNIGRTKKIECKKYKVGRQKYQYASNYCHWNQGKAKCAGHKEFKLSAKVALAVSSSAKTAWAKGFLYTMGRLLLTRAYKARYCPRVEGDKIRFHKVTDPNCYYAVDAGNCDNTPMAAMFDTCDKIVIINSSADDDDGILHSVAGLKAQHTKNDIVMNKQCLFHNVQGHFGSVMRIKHVSKNRMVNVLELNPIGLEKKPASYRTWSTLLTKRDAKEVGTRASWLSAMYKSVMPVVKDFLNGKNIIIDTKLYPLKQNFKKSRCLSSDGKSGTHL